MESKYRLFYKNNSNFVEQSNSVKRKCVKQNQKKKRDESFLLRRNISEGTTPPAPKSEIKETRRDKLLKWKAEKERILKEKERKEVKKPPFRAGVVHYAEDPLKSLPPPVPASTYKCGTQVKAASAIRTDAAARRKNNKPSAAAESLAGLSKQAPPATKSAPEFTGRVTRARAAAAAASLKSTQDLGVRKGTSKELSRNRAQSGLKKSVPVKKEPKNSFAPKDHKFKAPSSLTFPTTPQTLKRKSSKKVDVNAPFPSISGVTWLGASPENQTPRKFPKLQTSSKTPKLQTPSKTPKLRTPSKTPKLRTPSKTPKLRGKSPKTLNFVVSAKSPEQVKPVQHSPLKEDIIDDVDMKEMVPEMTKASSPPLLDNMSQTIPEGKESISSDQSDPMEVFQVRASRMSIHEPTPAVEVTPDKLNSGMVPAQFSPYITTARGKERHSSRRRTSIALNLSLSLEEHRKAKQVEHFRCLLENETTRLLQQCDSWDAIKTTAPSTAQDLILGAVGQARLLTKDKFQQFKRLIDKFETRETEEKITADDLFGFWEMMQLAVSNVNSRFEKLIEMQSNNWEEKLPEIVKKKKSVMTNAAPKSTLAVSQAKSRLKEMIEAARKKKQEAKSAIAGSLPTISIVPCNEEMSHSEPSSLYPVNPTPTIAHAKSNSIESVLNPGFEKRDSQFGNTNRLSCKTFDGGFFKVESPSKLEHCQVGSSQSPVPLSLAPNRCLGAPTTPGQVPRRSLLQHVLTNSAAHTLHSPANTSLHLSASPAQSPRSPSIRVVAAQLRASLLGRRVSMSSPVELDTSSQTVSSVSKATPARSILKSRQTSCLSASVQRNRVGFQLSSGMTSPLRLLKIDKEQKVTKFDENVTPTGQKRVSKRLSLAMKQEGDRPSLLPVRKSLSATKPLPGGDLISWDSPTEGRVLRPRTSIL